MNRSLYVTQSNYIPWKGYFDSIQKSDLFVVYDDVQFTKRDWRNRNIIKTAQGLKWLTIPVQVSGKFTQKICDTKVAQEDWNTKHWNIIKNEYKQASGWKEASPWLEELYRSCHYTFLTDINHHFITGIMRFLKIETPIEFSHNLNKPQERSERLLDLCRITNSNLYLSAPAAQNYLNEAIFIKNQITVQYIDYSGFKEYQQLHPPFEHKVSVIDLILNTGFNANKFLSTAL
jgi:hypothetical protein